MLGPVIDFPQPAEGEHAARMTAWEQERRAFERLMPRLSRRYRGRHVAIHRGRVVGSSADPDTLFERLWRKLGGQTFFIGRVGPEKRSVELPGFEIR